MKEDSKINYAEVDSDVDLDEEERELEQNNKNKGKKKAGDTFGTSNNNKKKRKTVARKIGGSEEAEESGDELEGPTYDSKLLLQLPFDLFAEMCSHLKGEDLLKLTQVNQAIRKTLLSRGSRSIWSSLRRRLSFALPSGLEELNFALLEHSDRCQYAYSAARPLPAKADKKEFDILARFRQKVSKVLGLIFILKLEAVSDMLMAVDEQLKELEEDDEIAVSLLQSLKSKRSSTRSRRSDSTVEEVEANNVDNFVKEKQQWVKMEQQTSHDIIANRERLGKLEVAAARAERQAVEARQNSILDSLQAQHGWKDDEIDYFRVNTWRFDELAPKRTIEEDPEAWNASRMIVRQRLDSEAARTRETLARNDRKTLLRPYFESLSTLHSSRYDVFPSFHHFANSSSIRPLWEPEDAAPLTDKVWKKNKHLALTVLNEYEEMNRVEAIRLILAANQGLASTSSLSRNSQDYPESTYDADFFCRMSSLFTLVDSNPLGHSISVAAYPRIVQEGTYLGPSSLNQRISVRHVHIIRSICKAVNLDADEAEMSHLEHFEDTFVWINDSRKTLRKIKRGWVDLLDEALRYGPTNRKIINGERIEVEYRPDDDSDDKSQAARETHEDEDGDEDEDEDEVDAEDGEKDVKKEDESDEE
ncbi:hypothetical protein JCM5350_001147 [Sporobolomyces pararoseus]